MKSFIIYAFHEFAIMKVENNAANTGRFEFYDKLAAIIWNI